MVIDFKKYMQNAIVYHSDKGVVVDFVGSAANILKVIFEAENKEEKIKEIKTFINYDGNAWDFTLGVSIEPSGKEMPALEEKK